jgi:hypothetical protein
VQIAAEDDERTLAARRKMKERALAAENQLRGAVAENEKLRLQVAALENDGMELAAAGRGRGADCSPHRHRGAVSSR